jgi:hypothetical protein
VRSYRVPLLGLVMLALATLAPVSTADAGEGIRIRGRHSAYLDVTIPSTGTITDAGIEIVTRGRYAGFFLLPNTSARPTVGALYMPRVGAGTDGGRLIQLGESWTVYPGGYRLYLLAETAADVFVPIDGMSARAYAPVRRAQVGLRPVDFAAGPSDQSAERRIRLALRGRRTLVAAAQIVTSASVTGVDAVRTCVTRASLECSDPVVVPTLRAPATAASSSSATVAPAGTYDAVFAIERAAGIHGETDVAATALTLALS